MAKDLLDKIKVLLGMEIKLTESKLKDGTNVSFDKLEIGSNFLVKTDSETAVPAPAGDYVMEDNTIVTVGSDGLITAVTPGNEVTTQEIVTPDVVVAPIDEDPEMTIEEKVVNMEERIAKLEEVITMIMGQYKDMDVKLSKIAESPAEVPVNLARIPKKEIEMTIADKRIAALDNLKNK